MFKTLGVIAVGILLVVLVIAGPFFVIWAWNILFGKLLLIDYTFWTWAAVLILGTFIRSPVKITKKS